MGYEVTVRELEPELLASVRVTAHMDEMGQVMSREFGHVMAIMSRQGVKPTGGAVAVYHSFTPDTADLEIGFTVAGVMKEEDGVGPGMLPGGPVAFTVYVGVYDEIEPAYRAMQRYAEEKGFELQPVMWEKYLTGPEEPDLSKHVTEIYWPLKA